MGLGVHDIFRQTHIALKQVGKPEFGRLLGISVAIAGDFAAQLNQMFPQGEYLDQPWLVDRRSLYENYGTMWGPQDS